MFTWYICLVTKERKKKNLFSILIFDSKQKFKAIFFSCCLVTKILLWSPYTEREIIDNHLSPYTISLQNLRCFWQVLVYNLSHLGNCTSVSDMFGFNAVFSKPSAIISIYHTWWIKWQLYVFEFELSGQFLYEEQENSHWHPILH